MLSRQKLALFGIAVAAGLVILGRWGMSAPAPRVQDLAAIFGGGFVAGLSAVRFVQNWRSASKSPEPAAEPATPPKTKS